MHLNFCILSELPLKMHQDIKAPLERVNTKLLIIKQLLPQKATVMFLSQIINRVNATRDAVCGLVTPFATVIMFLCYLFFRRAIFFTIINLSREIQRMSQKCIAVV